MKICFDQGDNDIRIAIAEKLNNDITYFTFTLFYLALRTLFLFQNIVLGSFFLQQPPCRCLTLKEQYRDILQ